MSDISALQFCLLEFEMNLRREKETGLCRAACVLPEILFALHTTFIWTGLSHCQQPKQTWMRTYLFVCFFSSSTWTANGFNTCSLCGDLKAPGIVIMWISILIPLFTVHLRVSDCLGFFPLTEFYSTPLVSSSTAVNCHRRSRTLQRSHRR